MQRKGSISILGRDVEIFQVTAKEMRRLAGENVQGWADPDGLKIYGQEQPCEGASLDLTVHEYLHVWIHLSGFGALLDIWAPKLLISKEQMEEIIVSNIAPGITNMLRQK